MEITLEKIELVKDRTGVSYKEAKDALIQTDGNVVDAIILIEDGIDVAPRNTAETTASRIVEELKNLVSKGNVTKILVKRDDQVVLNVPVNVGILGIVLVPWAAIISAVAALGLRCNISIVKSDGEVVDVVEKATSTFGNVRENYSSVADDLKEKGSEAVSKVKEKAGSVKNKVGAMDLFEDEDDLFEMDNAASDVEVTKAAEEAVESAAEKAESAAESFMGKAEEVKEAVEEKIDDIKEAVSDIFDKDDVEESFEDAISEFKNRVSDAAKDAERNVDAIIDELINDDADLYVETEHKNSELENLLAEAEKAGAEAEDALKGAQDALEDAVESGEEKFDSTINDLQEKKKRFRFFS